MKRTNRKLNAQRGAVSIFLVVFFALLVTVVTVSFVRLMVREQKRASDQDLSQSAYDSALAGVEDAKRAVTRYLTLSDSDKSDYNLNECNGITPLVSGTSVPIGDEVPIRRTIKDGSSGEELNQAYTCVKVIMDTEDYQAPIEQDRSHLIPLNTVSALPVTAIQLEWFTRDDNNKLDNITLSSDANYPMDGNWSKNTPPIIEAQLIQTPSSNFKLEDFDDSDAGKSNANTLFLYPKKLSISPASNFNDDVRRSDSDVNHPTGVKCEPKFSGSAVYACKTTINLPSPRGNGIGQRLLRLTARYNKANIKLTLKNGSQTIKFNGVQPLVDSTGRANDVFRRVEARIQTSDVGSNSGYPDAAVDISDNLCKTFSVGTEDGHYSAGDCTP